MPEPALYDALQAEITACLRRHASALEPMPPLASVMTVLGGAAIGSAAVSAALGSAVAVLVTLTAGALLLVPMASRVVHRARLRRDIARIRKVIAACPVTGSEGAGSA